MISRNCRNLVRRRAGTLELPLRISILIVGRQMLYSAAIMGASQEGTFTTSFYDLGFRNSHYDPA